MTLAEFARTASVEAPAGAERTRVGTRAFLLRALAFVAIGFGLYLVLYAGAEALVYQHALRNRFFAVRTADAALYDFLVLGASRAAVFDYADMNERLEQQTDGNVINLSVVGGGVTVNRLLLDYFLAGHSARNAIYVLDSFALYARQWNEERLSDVRLFDRAPFDPTLAGLLVGMPAGRSVALDYVTGFSKINNPDRFKPDMSDDEGLRFNSTYRPVRQIDAARMRYLYPGPIDQDVFQQYLGELRDLVRQLTAHNVRPIVIKAPLAERVYQMLPGEAEFDAAVAPMLAEEGADFHDFSLRCNDESHFYNTDHLNRAGVLNFYENCLVPLLTGRP